jgi:hypothetical protein
MHPIQLAEAGPRTLARGKWKNAWNWKCALFSAVARSVVYGVALQHSHNRDGVAVIAVEMLYVTLTAGLYAGLQQQALGLRSRRLGDAAIVVGVPGLSQLVDWLLHRAVGAPAPHRALLSACGFTLISALFHRHVMRHGGFLTGGQGHSLAEDFRRIPRLAFSFAVWPVMLLRSLPGRVERWLRPEDAGVAA